LMSECDTPARGRIRDIGEEPRQHTGLRR